MTKTRLAVACVLFFALAGSAAAFTVSELTQRADTLQTVLADLESRVSACPSGACTERAAIESDFAAAEADRLQLQSDRSTLGTCSSCQAMDATLAELSGVAGDIAGIIDTWEGGG